MTTKPPKYRKLYTKISASPDVMAELDKIRTQLTEENPNHKPTSYNTAIRYLIQNQTL